MLFRQAAIDAQRVRIAGQVLVATPLSYRVVTLFLTALLCAALGFVTLASFPRIERVTGRLVPAAGVVHVTAPADGIVRGLALAEGDGLAAGTVLGQLHTARETPANATRLAAELERAGSRIAAVQEQIARARQIADMELQALERRSEVLVSQIARQQALVELQSAILQEITETTARQEMLVARGATSPQAFSEQTLRLLEARKNLRLAQDTLANLEAQRDDVPLARDQAIARAAQQQAVLQADLRIAQDDRAVLLGAQVFDIAAPAAGRMTALLARDGQSVTEGQILLSILPADSALQAELLVPSSAIGFLQPGQSVRILLDAFPYQRFGGLDGTITDISANVLPEAVAASQGRTGQALYRVRVALARQTLLARGQERALQAGMALRANIILEERSVLMWLLDPVISVMSRG
jgi:membrane fusion protein